MDVPASDPLVGGRLSYFFLFVSNFSEMFRFYHDQLGFEALFFEEDSYAFLRLPQDEGPQLALYADKEKAAHQQHIFLAIDVPDLDAAIQALSARGVQVEEVRDVPYGRAACMTDPAGNTVELHEPSESASQDQ